MVARSPPANAVNRYRKRFTATAHLWVLTVWLWHVASIRAVQSRLQDYQFSHAGRVLELEQAWVEEE